LRAGILLLANDLSVDAGISRWNTWSAAGLVSFRASANAFQAFRTQQTRFLDFQIPPFVDQSLTLLLRRFQLVAFETEPA